MVQPTPVPLLGRLAIHLQLIRMEQLEEALRVRGRPGEERNIGRILVDLGFITRVQLEKLLAEQQKVVEKHRAKQAAGGAVAEKHGAEQTGERSAAPSRKAASPAPADLAHVLREAVARGASDLHLRSGQRPMLRVAGTLVAWEGPHPGADATRAMLLDALGPDERAELERCGEVDFCHTIEGLGRFRSNVYREQCGLDGVFRHVPATPPSLAALGLPQSVAKLTNYHQGLVLVTGPAGCGKTSTLACLVDMINEERRHHVLTIEDPIEYLHVSKRSLVNQRSVKRHTGSFARALRAALREDPDVIVIGELRDLETISLALTAAETGHLVMATIHTGDSLRTITRIVGAYPPEQQEQVRTMLSESLRAVLSQRLLARADGKGRAVALETLIITKAVANLIRENKVFQIQSILQTGQRHGMQSLERSVDQLLADGTITPQEAARHGASSKRAA